MSTIVILAGGITEKGNLSKNSKKRAEKAYQIFKENPNFNVLACGKYSFLYSKNNIPLKTEAEATKEYLLRLGVPEKNIFIEEKSKDTIGNAYYAKKLYFIPKKEKKLLVITSDFHLERVGFIFRKVFGSKYQISFDCVSSIFKNKKEEKRIVERQKELLLKTEKMLYNMKVGDHDFLKGKLYKLKYYKEKRSNWVISFTTKGK